MAAMLLLYMKKIAFKEVAYFSKVYLSTTSFKDPERNWAVIPSFVKIGQLVKTLT
jgi:hypothetical protein